MTLLSTLITAGAAIFTPSNEQDINTTADLIFAASDNKVEMSISNNPLSDPEQLKRVINLIDGFVTQNDIDPNSYNPGDFYRDLLDAANPSEEKYVSKKIKENFEYTAKILSEYTSRVNLDDNQNNDVLSLADLREDLTELYSTATGKAYKSKSNKIYQM